MDKGLYKIKKHDSNNFDVYLSGELHPVFQAHFVGNPILPGFIFLHICERALNITITEVAKAKFISFAKPNDVLRLAILRKENLFMAEFILQDKKICVLTFKGERFE